MHTVQNATCQNVGVSCPQIHTWPTIMYTSLAISPSLPLYSSVSILLSFFLFPFHDLPRMLQQHKQQNGFGGRE